MPTWPLGVPKASIASVVELELKHDVPPRVDCEDQQARLPP